MMDEQYSIDGRVIPTLNGFKAYNGGKGSGNFGHSGRPGKVGGSAERGIKAARREKPTTDKRPTQRQAEDRYHKEFLRAKGLGYELYDSVMPDLRYTLEGLNSRYQALLYHETTSDEASREYREEIKEIIKEVKSDIETLRTEYDSPKLAKSVEDHIAWFEKNPLPEDW